ncbi:unnamed protein product [Prorocentrum cordatum]|uniref:Mei2-like C-terminal RNA recognition motif domain-containing protein n=1 Tax=Prorocentrum cordatum TaxID=2364126 RepID=A0ABN9Y8S5_9DINO|nr:unnamed protein product [Polarella glacialis]
MLGLRRFISEMGFGEAYDYLYLPRCLRTHQSKGYAFINLFSREVAQRFIARMLTVRKEAWGTLRFSPAETQGLANNVVMWHRGHSRHVRDPEVLPFVRPLHRLGLTVRPLHDLGLTGSDQLLQLNVPAHDETRSTSIVGAEAAHRYVRPQHAPHARSAEEDPPAEADDWRAGVLAAAAGHCGQGQGLALAEGLAGSLRSSGQPEAAAADHGRGRQLQPLAAPAAHAKGLQSQQPATVAPSWARTVGHSNSGGSQPAPGNWGGASGPASAPDSSVSRSGDPSGQWHEHLHRPQLGRCTPQALMRTPVSITSLNSPSFVAAGGGPPCATLQVISL